MKKERLDQALVRMGLSISREKAKRLIMAGEVKVDGHVCDKASHALKGEERVEVRQKERFVSRAGQKLEGALQHFDADVEGKVAMDVGSSTGGFTDCLLQRGIKKVYAFDVGTNQMVWKLREDPRVILREQCNARHLEPSDVPEKIEVLVMDVSFISVCKILPVLVDLLAPDAEGYILVKPQFELQKEEVAHGGVVLEEALQLKAVEKVRTCCEELGWSWQGVVKSTVKGTEGNQEYVASVKC